MTMSYVSRPSRVLLVTSVPLDAEDVSKVLAGSEVPGGEVPVLAASLSESRLAYWVSDADDAIEDARTVAVQTAQAVEQTQKVEPSRQQVEEAAKTVNEFLKPINNSINFSLDEDTGITVVKVIDVATKEVIRKIHSEEMLVIAKTIDQMKGLLVQQKA